MAAGTGAGTGTGAAYYRMLVPVWSPGAADAVPEFLLYFAQQAACIVLSRMFLKALWCICLPTLVREQFLIWMNYLG